MKTSFETLPQAVDTLICQVENLTKVLIKKEDVSKTLPRVLTVVTASQYIRQKGIPMSKSKLYKLVSSRSVTFPFRRAGSRLLFYTDELDVWCDAQIKHPLESRQASMNAIVKSAQNKQ